METSLEFRRYVLIVTDVTEYILGVDFEHIEEIAISKMTPHEFHLYYLYHRCGMPEPRLLFKEMSNWFLGTKFTKNDIIEGLRTVQKLVILKYKLLKLQTQAGEEQGAPIVEPYWEYYARLEANECERFAELYPEDVPMPSIETRSDGIETDSNGNESPLYIPTSLDSLMGNYDIDSIKNISEDNISDDNSHDENSYDDNSSDDNSSNDNSSSDNSSNDNSSSDNSSNDNSSNDNSSNDNSSDNNSSDNNSSDNNSSNDNSSDNNSSNDDSSDDSGQLFRLESEPESGYESGTETEPAEPESLPLGGYPMERQQKATYACLKRQRQILYCKLWQPNPIVAQYNSQNIPANWPQSKPWPLTYEDDEEKYY